MKLAGMLLLAIIAVAVIACQGSAPAPQTESGNTAGAATEIERVFDQGFPEDETTTYSDDFDSLDSDLAMS